jgi:hypothetical protein
METIFNVIGSKTYKNLLADPKGADLITVPVYPNVSALSAGALLTRNSAGLWQPIASGSIADNVELVVLMEDVPANDTAIATDATAARAGCFIDGVVKESGGSAPTAAQKLILRKQGIVFKPDVTADPFANSYTVTYVPNNGTTEDPVVKTEIAGATHTVLNNSDASLSFTAPATKSFSKWNTKADGSGTDKAAASTITMTEDVVLYAVWA